MYQLPVFRRLLELLDSDIVSHAYLPPGEINNLTGGQVLQIQKRYIQARPTVSQRRL
jgi:hypothetical protein